MPQPCTICTNPQREAIDRALVESTPKRRIAAQHGLAESAVRRHAAAHLPKALVKATEAQEIAHADDLLGTLRRGLREVLEVLDHAKATGNPGGVLQATDRIPKLIALLATLEASDSAQLSRRYELKWLGPCCAHPDGCPPEG